MKKLIIFFAHGVLMAAPLFADSVDVRNVGKEDIRISMGRNKKVESVDAYTQKANDNGWLGVPSETLEGATLNVELGKYYSPSFIFVSEGHFPKPGELKNTQALRNVGAEHQKEAFVFDLTPLKLKTLTGIVYFHDKDDRRRMVVEGIEDRYTNNKVAVVIDGNKK